MLDLCKGEAFFHTDMLSLVTLQFYPGSNPSMDKNVYGCPWKQFLAFSFILSFQKLQVLETENKETMIKIIDT